MAGIQPGVMYEGDDLGAWLVRQSRNWAELSAEQQQRLTALGITPAKQPTPPPAGHDAGVKPSAKAQQAFQRGLTALARWTEREGTGQPVPRGHSEEIVIEGEAEPVAVRLGVWISNTKTRRDKLTPNQRTALQETGVEWV